MNHIDVMKELHENNAYAELEIISVLERVGRLPAESMDILNKVIFYMTLKQEDYGLLKKRDAEKLTEVRRGI